MLDGLILNTIDLYQMEESSSIYMNVRIEDVRATLLKKSSVLYQRGHLYTYNDYFFHRC